jgi:hypothetical protein
VDLVNLAFSGSALLDPFTGRTTPLLVVPSILCPIHEDTPGPCAMTIDPVTKRTSFHATGTPEPGRLTLRIIRQR